MQTPFRVVAGQAPVVGGQTEHKPLCGYLIAALGARAGAVFRAAARKRALRGAHALRWKGAIRHARHCQYHAGGGKGAAGRVPTWP
jgi:hypothetical protein